MPVPQENPISKNGAAAGGGDGGKDEYRCCSLGMAATRM